MPTRPSRRSRPTLTTSNGFIAAKTVTIQRGEITTFEIPNAVRRAVLKNVSDGLTPPSIRFNFNNDDVSDSYTLAPGDVFPSALDIAPGTIINLGATGGTGNATLDVVVWG